MYCLKENVKICYGCALSEEHKGHLMKKINELKAEGVKMKKHLEESFLIFEENQWQKVQQARLLKNDFLIKMGDKFEDIKDLLKIKELEWTKEIENLFERNIENDKRPLLRNEAEKIIKEISQACKEEENNFAILNQSFSPIISRLEGKEAFKLSEETSRAMDCIEYFLVKQEKSLKKFDFLNNETQPEQFEQEQFEAIQRSSIMEAETRFSLETNQELLTVDIKNSVPMRFVVDLEELNKMKGVKIELEQYDALSLGSADLNFVSEILQQLDNYTSLEVIFTPLGLSDLSVFILFDHLFCRIQQLEDLKIAFGSEYFGEYQITDEMMEFFCTAILPKAASLRNLTLSLGSSLITNHSLFDLATSLSPLSKNLESFRLEAGNTAITDNGVEKIFNVIPGVKVLDLGLKGTFVTDKSLRLLRNHMASCMKNLEKFSIDLSETKITIEGVSAIFAGIPKGIRSLNLDFSRIALPDEVVFMFEEMVCPKLGLVEEVHLRLEERNLALKTSKILDSVRKDAAKRRRATLQK